MNFHPKNRALILYLVNILLGKQKCSCVVVDRHGKWKIPQRALWSFASKFSMLLLLGEILKKYEMIFDKVAKDYVVVLQINELYLSSNVIRVHLICFLFHTNQCFWLFTGSMTQSIRFTKCNLLENVIIISMLCPITEQRHFTFSVAPGCILYLIRHFLISLSSQVSNWISNCTR